MGLQKNRRDGWNDGKMENETKDLDLRLPLYMSTETYLFSGHVFTAVSASTDSVNLVKKWKRRHDEKNH